MSATYDLITCVNDDDDNDTVNENSNLLGWECQVPH